MRLLCVAADRSRATAKLAGTERGITEPTPTFSACFGQAFLELHPTKYAEELVKRMELTHLLSNQHLSQCVVDFVRTRMVQILTFQIQLTAVLLAHTFRQI